MMNNQRRVDDGGDCAIAITCLGEHLPPAQHHSLEPPANIRWLALLVPSTCCAQYAPLTDAPMGPILCLNYTHTTLQWGPYYAQTIPHTMPILRSNGNPYYAHTMANITDICPILTCSLPESGSAMHLNISPNNLPVKAHK